MESPYKSAPDSPSRQLLWELSRLSVSEQERLYQQLDLDAEERETLHRQALERAAAEHERVRHDAEEARSRLERERAVARERKALEEQRELNRLNEQRLEEKARFERQQAEREAEVRKAEALRRAQAEQAEREAEREVERERQERERAAEAERRREVEREEEKRRSQEAEAKAKEAALAARRKQGEAKAAATASAQAAQAPASVTVNGDASTTTTAPKLEDAEAEHKRYLEIWQRLKELRNFVKQHAKTNPDFKAASSESRRVIRKCIGQLVTGSSDPQANRQPNMQIREVLRNAHHFTQPTVPLRDFLHKVPDDVQQAEIPAMFLYLLNIFSKCLIGQFLGEVAIAPRTATAIGITAATIFAQPDCQWQGHSLIDIFIAKYHRVCPVLFGIYGNDKTAAGKSRLGWWMDTGAYVTEQRHYERMTGLGAGFASITLRAYKTRAAPYPAWHYWQAAARILNVPKEQVTATHLVVLKAMIEGNEPRILEFFGRAGLVLLRTALKDFPASLPIRDGVAAKALLLMPDVLRTEQKLFI